MPPMARPGWGVPQPGKVPTPMARSGSGIPQPGQVGVPPQVRSSGSSPPPVRSGGGYLPPRTGDLWTGYAAGSMPLAVYGRRTFFVM